MVTILFDGDCGLCNRTVRFVMKRDRRSQFRFLPQASPEGSAILRDSGLSHLDAIVVVHQGRYFVESNAVLYILSRLGFPWKLAGIFRILPKSWRDAVYRRIAANRLEWFGQSDVCELPDYFDKSAQDQKG